MEINVHLNDSSFLPKNKVYHTCPTDMTWTTDAQTSKQHAIHPAAKPREHHYYC